MDRGCNDMRGSFAGKLYDPFSEIGFDRIETLGFERVIEVDLFGRHALCFDDVGGADLADQLEYDVAGFPGIACPMKDRAGFLGIGRKLLKVTIEVGKRLVLYTSGCLTQTFPVVDGVNGFTAAFTEGHGQMAQGTLELRIVKSFAGVLIECFGR